MAQSLKFKNSRIARKTSINDSGKFSHSSSFASQKDKMPKPMQTNLSETLYADGKNKIKK